MNSDRLWDKLWDKGEHDLQSSVDDDFSVESVPGLAAVLQVHADAIRAVLEAADWGPVVPVNVDVRGLVPNEDDPCERKFDAIHVTCYLTGEVLGHFPFGELETFLLEYELGDWSDVRIHHDE